MSWKSDCRGSFVALANYLTQILQLSAFCWLPSETANQLQNYVSGCSSRVVHSGCSLGLFMCNADSELGLPDVCNHDCGVIHYPESNLVNLPQEAYSNSMIFWSKKKRRYPLPKFPDNIIPTFQALCDEITGEQVEELKNILHNCLLQAIEKSKSNPNFDLPGAEALVNCSLFLLDHYPDFPIEHQRLVVGAVRYFAIGDDPFDDEVFATGLYDDKRIMNHVLEELDIHDRYLDLEY